MDAGSRIYPARYNLPMHTRLNPAGVPGEEGPAWTARRA
jgi:hypothetical protein